MKVLHVIPSVSAKRGGPSQAVIQMVAALRRAGIDAEIATTNDDGDDTLKVETKVLTSFQDVPVRFFNKTHLSLKFLTPIANAVNEFSFSISLALWLHKNIKHYDLVHVHAIFSFPSTIAMWIARRQKTPYISRTIGQLDQWSLNQSRARKQKYLQLIERQNLIGSAALHCTSESEATAVADEVPEARILTIPLGLEIPMQISSARRKVQQRYRLSAGAPIFLFLSRLHPKKGLETLLEATAQFEVADLHLLIAGDGSEEYKTLLQEQSKRLGIDSTVKFLGHVRGTEKNMLLQGADAFVLPSHSENFGIAVLESLANGTAVIVSEGVALSSLVADNQLGAVCTLDKDSLRSAMAEVIDDTDRFAELGSKARDYTAQHFQWNAIAQKLVKSYHELVS